MAHVSDIKLIRTDTTLDLSQKAERKKVCLIQRSSSSFYVPALRNPAPASSMWENEYKPSILLPNSPSFLHYYSLNANSKWGEERETGVVGKPLPEVFLVFKYLKPPTLFLTP
ncbi:hypothetical protein Ancab_030366 [Ancistrocladus abbreviatus]